MAEVHIPPAAATDASLIPLLQHLDKRHHLFNPAQDGDSDESHVYALISTSPYVDDKDNQEIHIVIPIGPIHIILQGEANFASFDVDINVYLKVPILPLVKIGVFKGNLKNGITIKVGIAGILSGSLTLYVKEIQGHQWLCLKGELQIYHKKYTFDIKLFRIPLTSDNT